MMFVKRISSKLTLLAAGLSAVTGLSCTPRPPSDSSVTIAGPSGKVHALAFAPDGRTLAFSSMAKGAGVKVWDLHKCAETFTLEIPPIVPQLAYAPSGQLTAWSGLWERKIYRWDKDGRILPSPHVNANPVSEMFYCSSNDTFVLAKDDARHQTATLTLHDAKRGDKLKCVRISGGVVGPLSATSDGRLLAVAAMYLAPANVEPAGMHVLLWDMKTGVASLPLHIPGYPDRVKLSPDGRLLAAWWCNESMRVDVWDLQRRSLAAVLQPKSVASLEDVEFSPDGTRLATGAGVYKNTIAPFLPQSDSRGEVRHWDLVTARNVETLLLRQPVTVVAFSDDGRSFAAGCNDGTVQCWINKFRGIQRGHFGGIQRGHSYSTGQAGEVGSTDARR